MNIRLAQRLLVPSDKMIKLCVCGNNLTTTPAFSVHPKFSPRVSNSYKQQKPRIVTAFATKIGGFSLNSILQGCKTCGGKGAIECPGCKGTGKNKKNGNIFERWKCFDCQGFGLIGCPKCGQGGLTPEQRGER